MDFSERNRKVAIARWKNVHENEKANFSRNETAYVMRAALYGFMAGDGNLSLRGDHNELRFFPDDGVMLEAILCSLKYVYNIYPSISVRDNVLHVRKTSKSVAMELSTLAEHGTYSWNVPSFVKGY